MDSVMKSEHMDINLMSLQKVSTFTEHAYRAWGEKAEENLKSCLRTG